MRGKNISIAIGLFIACLIMSSYSSFAGVADQLQQANNLFKNKQYDQAEQIYLAIAPQDIPEAFTAQKNLTTLYITTDRLPQADSAFQQLLSRFAGNNGLPKAIYDIGRRYEETNKNDKAFQLYEYNLEHFPDNTYAMWSLTGIAKYHIRDGNEPAADAAVDRLLTMFPKEPGLAEQIHYVARKHEQFRNYTKAFKLYRYNVEHFPNDIYAMRSQVRIVRLNISDSNTPAANAVFDKLVTLFSYQATLSEEVYKIAKQFTEAGNNQKSRQIYQYVIDTWTSDEHIDARKFVVASHIAVGNEKQAQVELDKLIVDFNKHLDLPAVIFGIVEQYLGNSIRNQNNGLDAQARDDLTRALNLCERIITEFPESTTAPRACRFAAYCCRRLGKYDMAIEYCRKAIETWPDYKYESSTKLMMEKCLEELDKSRNK